MRMRIRSMTENMKAEGKSPEEIRAAVQKMRGQQAPGGRGEGRLGPPRGRGMGPGFGQGPGPGRGRGFGAGRGRGGPGRVDPQARPQTEDTE